MNNIFTLTSHVILGEKMKKILKNLRVPILVQIIFTILYSITVALFPVLNKMLFDNIMDEGLSYLATLVFLYLLLIILNGVFQYFARLYEWIVNKDFNIEIRSSLFENIASMNNKNFKEKSPAEYLAVFNNNVNIIYDDYISASIDLIKSSLNIIIFSSALFIFVDWRITLVVISTSLITAYIPRIMQKKLSSKRKEQLQSLSDYFKITFDLISGKKRINKFTFKAFTTEHNSRLKRSEEDTLVFGKTKTVADLINALGIFLIQLSTFITVALLLINKQITLGTGIAAFGYVSSFIRPIQNILECVNCIHSTKDTIDETMAYIHGNVLEPIANVINPAPVESLELSNIAHKVDNFTFQPLSYTFQKGKKYAVVGHSGSGKSTLLNIIDGTIENKDGIIKIDEKNVNDINRDEYIFSLDQFEHLFQTSFLNNVTIFNSTNDNMSFAEGLIERLRAESINRIMAYDSVEQLSGGEKQIICILRMLVSNRPIILMDESYANIDRDNARVIKEYIRTLKDKIVIEVTHDVSHENLSRFDGVLTFDDGKLCEA